MAKTCESCKAIWAEKMQQVVQKESDEVNLRNGSSL